MVELKDTLLMPKTDFPMRGNLPNKEPNFLKRWEEMDLYRKVLEKMRGNLHMFFMMDLRMQMGTSTLGMHLIKF